MMNTNYLLTETEINHDSGTLGEGGGGKGGIGCHFLRMDYNNGVPPYFMHTASSLENEPSA